MNFSLQFGILNCWPENNTSNSEFRKCVGSFRIFCASLSTDQASINKLCGYGL